MRKRSLLPALWVALSAPFVSAQQLHLAAGVGEASFRNTGSIGFSKFAQIALSSRHSEWSASVHYVPHQEPLRSYLSLRPSVNDLISYFSVEAWHADLSWLYRWTERKRLSITTGGGVVYVKGNRSELKTITMFPNSEKWQSASFQEKGFETFGVNARVQANYRLLNWLSLQASGAYVFIPESPKSTSSMHLADPVLLNLGLRFTLQKKQIGKQEDKASPSN